MHIIETGVPGSESVVDATSLWSLKITPNRPVLPSQIHKCRDVFDQNRESRPKSLFVRGSNIANVPDASHREFLFLKRDPECWCEAEGEQPVGTNAIGTDQVLLNFEFQFQRYFAYPGGF